jgi:vancomycin permeability regulator SanA
MMRRLFKLIFQLVMSAVVIFLLTAAWIVFDGLNDSGGKADVALVSGQPEGAVERALLDRVIELYNGGEFPAVIVSGTDTPSSFDHAAAMAEYLEGKGIPANAITQNRRGGTMPETAARVAAIMKLHRFESVMVVADYYHITRLKLALGQEGVAEIDKAHIGALRKEDAWKIGREVLALYDYVGRVYLLPLAEKAKDEAKVGLDKAGLDAQKAKESVNKGLDNLPK